MESFYGVINNGGVITIHSLAVWKLCVPPRIHIFLWIVINNKVLTRDSKRGHVDDKTCVLYSELESADHLFFGCLVAQQLLNKLADVFDIPIGSNLITVHRWWISNDKDGVLNIFISYVL
jgi:hypothetical protein